MATTMLMSLVQAQLNNRLIKPYLLLKKLIFESRARFKYYSSDIVESEY